MHSRTIPHSVFITILLSMLSHWKISAQQLDSWTQRALFPGTPRQDAAAFAAAGKGYIVTGKDSSGNYLNDTWAYDPSTDTWNQVAPFPGAARHGAVGFSINDTGYVATGNDGTNELTDCWRYVPATDSWSACQAIGAFRSGSFPGRSHSTAITTNSYAYITCGYDGSPGYLKQTLRYYAANDTNWSVVRNFGNVSDLTLFGRRWGAGFSIGTSVYFGTGFTYSQDIKKDFWRFDPGLNSWIQLSDFGGDIRSNAFGFSLYGKGYIGCGSNGNYSAEVWRYQPGTDSWTRINDFGGSPRVNAACFVINNRAYVTGGLHTSGTTLNDTWEYTPDSTSGISSIEPPALKVIVTSASISIVSIDAMTSHATDAQVMIYDISGKCVRSALLHYPETQVSLIGLPAGSYIYRIGTPDQNMGSGKFIH